MVPTNLSKIEKFANGLPTDFGPIVKLATTLKAAIWADKNAEIQIREQGLEKAEAEEKRKFEGFQGPIIKVYFQMLTPTTRSVGVIVKRIGVKSARRNTLRDVVKR